MPAGEKIRVVIVDDVSETRENVKKLLQFEADVDVVGIARTGKEAIQISQELSPDVVLMDINLPRKSGREVLADVKSDPQLARIPVVVLTTSKADEDVAKAYEFH